MTMRAHLVDYSGTVAAAATAQFATPAQANSAGQQGRMFLLIHNPDASTDLWYNFETAAVAAQPSIRLPAGATHIYDTFIPVGQVSVLSGTINKPFVVKAAI